MLSLLFQQPLLFAVWLLAILVALSMHEFSHALIATLLGDRTAKSMGRLTLNPAAHVDALGLLALVTVGFGWGKPVPFNTYNLRNQRWGPVLIAVGGPVMNLAVATVLGLIFRIVAPALGETILLYQFLLLAVFLNLALLFFNLIPIPPLDGSKFLLALLSAPQYAGARQFLETRGPFLLLGLILVDMLLKLNIFSTLFRLINFVMKFVVGFGI